MLKILQARLQQYVNRKLPDVQAGLRNGKEPEIKLPTSAGSWENKRVLCFIDYFIYLFIYPSISISIYPSISALLTMPKPLTVWITINCGKF